MKNLLNKLIAGICLIFIASFSQAQGLEGIIVEKYYISNATDFTNTGLPTGSVTYRVYVDMAAGYSLQAVYGDNVDILRFYSSANFFNDATNGASTANGVSNGVLTSGAAIVDSWFSFGSGGGTRRGVAKAADVDGGLATPLTNNDPMAGGQALTTHDGRFNSGPNALAMSIAGFDPDVAPFDVFYNAIVGNDFTTVSLPSGGVIASTGGAATGPTGDNRVLIGQFTTTGTFGYTINLQLGTPTPGVSEVYVATTPGPGELTHATLTLAPNDPPVITSFTATPNGSVVVGTNINLAATATDAAPGTVTSVKFYHNGTLIANDNTDPYGTSFAAVSGANTFIARAFDNLGDSSATSTIVVTGGANQAPTVTISGVPAAITAPDVVTVVASPFDADGTINNVKFYLEGVLVFTDNAAPFQYAWTSVAGNDQTFTATATDNLLLTGPASAGSDVDVVNNFPPTSVLTSPISSGAYTAPAIVPLAATATDIQDVVSPGSVTKVKFLVNGVVVGEDLTSPYTFNWVSTIGTAVFTARSFDNRNDSTTSAPVTLEIADPNALPYRITNLTQTCESPTFCLTIAAVDAVQDVIGYDFVLSYDNTKVTPTGVIIINADLTDSTDVDVANSIDDANGKMNISLYFNSGAPNGATWNGIGDIMCVQFAKKAYPVFGYVDSATFTITVQESYVDGVQYPQSSAGEFKTYKDSLVISPLTFWADNSPIVYTNAATHLITNIYGTNNAANDINGSCANRSSVPVQPNASGFFSHSIWNGTYVDIERDILSSTSVQPVVNGYDVYLVRRLLILDPTFRPSIYQMIAMDVNRDGVISAGDASQIAQRAVLQYPEFRQAWNYNVSGVRLAGSGDSKDWTFLLGSAITTTPSYGISTTFPNDNLVGFSKYRVPVIPFCLQAPVINAMDCPIISEETFIGVMLGDVNGNYSGLPSSATLRSSDRVVFNLSKAVTTGNFIDIPVSIVSGSEVNAMDFSMQFNHNALSYNAMISNAPNTQMVDYFNANDNTLRFSSNSLDNYNLAQSIVSVRFELKKGKVDASDLLSVNSYLNGNLVATEIRGSNGTVRNNNVIANVYPNPTSGMLFVSVEEDATIQLFDISGKELMLQTNVIANKETELNVSQVENGIYLMRISNNNFVSTKKIVINK